MGHSHEPVDGTAAVVVDVQEEVGVDLAEDAPVSRVHYHRLHGEVVAVQRHLYQLPLLLRGASLLTRRDALQGGWSWSCTSIAAVCTVLACNQCDCS